MRTSYSALNTFEQCPQKFKFQILDKIKAPKSVEAVFGTTVHSALKFMFSHDPLFPTLEQILNNFSETWRISSTNIYPILATELKDTYEESGKAMIRKFYTKNPPWVYSVVDTESHFEVSLPDLETNTTHVVAGIIDRIDKTEDGSYEIIDYKTARKLPGQSTIDNDLQLSLYHMALINRWPSLDPQKIQLSLYFLKHNEKLTTTRDRTALADTVKKVINTIREIEKRTTENKFPPNPSALCDYCPYKKICPAWRHLYTKEAPQVDEDQLQRTVQEYFAIKEKDTENAKRLKELQNIVSAYMKTHGIDRVFDERGYFIAKRLQQRFKYDFDKIHAIMLAANLEKEWNMILEADEKKLKLIVNTLPPHIRDKIAEQKHLSKEFTTLIASSKPVKK